MCYFNAGTTRSPTWSGEDTSSPLLLTLLQSKQQACRDKVWFPAQAWVVPIVLCQANLSISRRIEKHGHTRQIIDRPLNPCGQRFDAPGLTILGCSCREQLTALWFFFYAFPPVRNLQQIQLYQQPRRISSPMQDSEILRHQMSSAIISWISLKSGDIKSTPVCFSHVLIKSLGWCIKCSSYLLVQAFKQYVRMNHHF